jgi:hypothetical protein
VLACEADPTTGSVRLWSKMREASAPASWLVPFGATYALERYGMIERFDTPGLDRIYVEAYDLAGTGDGGSVTYAVTVTLGPCVLE